MNITTDHRGSGGEKNSRRLGLTYNKQQQCNVTLYSTIVKDKILFIVTTSSLS